MRAIVDDCHQAVRRLARSSRVSIAVILLTALAVGANAAVFSITKAVLLRSLPFANPDRLVSVEGLDKARRFTTLPFPALAELRQSVTGTVGLAAATWDLVDVTTGSDVFRVREAAVSGNFLQVLGVVPLQGRLLVENDEIAGHVVVLTEATWKGMFGADPQVLSRSITLNNSARPGIYRVVGIVPSDAILLRFPEYAFYVPATPVPAMESWRVASYSIVARLEPAISLRTLDGQVNAALVRLAHAYAVPSLAGGVAVPLHAAEVGGTRGLLTTLSLAVGLLLLMACLNIAGLLVSTGTDREQELSVRTAVGASRLRLARQLGLENVLLALVGGGVGVLLAFAGHHFLVNIAAPDLPRLSQSRVDLSVLMFCAAAALACALLFGTLPVALLSGRGSNPSLLSHRIVNPRRDKLQDLLLGSQLALVLAVMIVSTVTLVSFARLLKVDTGFDAENVVGAECYLGDRYTSSMDMFDATVSAVGAAIARSPVVGVVAVSSAMPPDERDLIALRLPDGTGLSPIRRQISPQYFEVLRMPIVQGRILTPADRRTTYAVINATFARRLTGDPLGQVLSVSPSLAYTVVGVIQDARERRLSDDPSPTLYTPFLLPARHIWFLVRGNTENADALGSLRASLSGALPDVPVMTATSMEARLAISRRPLKFLAATFLVFAIAGVCVAAVGVFSSMYQSTRARLPEIGIRLALGATRSSIAVLFLRRMAVVVGAASTVGAGLGIALGQTLRSTLFSTAPTSPVMIFAAVAGLIAVTFLASSFPIRRALGTDPLVCLRRT